MKTGRTGDEIIFQTSCNICLFFVELFRKPEDVQKEVPAMHHKLRSFNLRYFR